MPSFLNWSDFGMSTAAMNDMSLLGARSRWIEAEEVFQTNIAFLSVVAGISFLAFSVVIAILPEPWLPQVAGGAKPVLILLAAYVAIGILTNGLAAGYRGQQKYARWLNLNNGVRSADILITTILLVARMPEFNIVTGLLLNKIFWLGIISYDFARNSPHIRIGFSKARRRVLSQLWKPAIGNMCFPIGQSLGIQAATVAVGYALNPAAVAIYAIARTYGRILLQLVSTMNVVAWPEFSYALGSNDLELARALYRRLQKATGIMILAGMMVMWPLGPWIIAHWIHDRIQVGYGLVGAHLMLVALSLAWNSSHVVLLSVNHVVELGFRYIASTGVALGAMVFVLHWRDLTAATLALGIADVYMLSYARPVCRRILSYGIASGCAMVINA
ncbi:MAG TPA: hypothetical protein VG722_09880 [Tepidisphaeraceae bacterium]|nr:hypothetical protein [Tepidisphaeraceae bacterium]